MNLKHFIIESVDVKAKMENGEDLVLIDCRDPDEYEIVTING